MLKRRVQQQGLTLVELLVAISVLAFVAVLGWRGLDGIVRARVALNEDLEHTRGMQLAFAQLQSDCASIVSRSPLSNNRGPIQAGPEQLVLIRTVFADNQPTRLQVVNYRVRDGRLMRQQTVPTRDLQELESGWQAMLNGTYVSDAIELQSGVASMRMRLWNNNGWQSAESSAAQGASASSGENAFAEAKARRSGQPMGATVAQQWSGLEVAMQLVGRDASMLKVFLLGSV
ncbi:prepilin-type N-terminal cleavage/methylation domain-containing protein [Oxalobacteraceae bacterium R-40]|uniref:Prepilin-type N-terminal cleavage/methylation domain-containing protein n=1 Tax=Keguizhuia sedimenti TaxID=3064264 RepID=A0ABU1BJD9_9BURK|nr:prepilin-type N-terminal cleavage/methylation domain-containing protein [Oxalobacteraceae bacterium R-40]